MTTESTKISLILAYMGLVVGICYLSDHLIVPNEDVFIQIGVAVLLIFPLNLAFKELLKNNSKGGLANPTPREDAVTKYYLDDSTIEVTPTIIKYKDIPKED